MDGRAIFSPAIRVPLEHEDQQRRGIQKVSVAEAENALTASGIMDGSMSRSSVASRGYKTSDSGRTIVGLARSRRDQGESSTAASREILLAHTVVKPVTAGKLEGGFSLVWSKGTDGLEERLGHF